jgi:hypothetical protein
MSCCWIALIWCNSIAVAAQGILASIENSIKSNEPGWTLTSKENHPTSTIYFWRSGKKLVDAAVFLTDSDQAASDLMRLNVQKIPVPPQETLRGLGDEALLYHRGTSTNGAILFRKDKVFIRLTGTSVADALRFAHRIGDVLPAK